MPARTGEDYIESLRDSREVYFKGERIDDVTEHPATRGMVETQAELYDLQHSEEYRDVLTYESPETGERESVFWKKPRSKADLRERWRASKVWADHTGGMASRTTDFLATRVTAMAIGSREFDHGDRDYGRHMREYYEHCRENDISLTHAVVDPQIDRSESSAYRQADDGARPGAVRKVAETEDGIVISGARMLATLGPQAEEIVIYPFGRYSEGEEDEAIAAAVPLDADGLRHICRPSVASSDARNHPLAGRLDEMDTFVVFDDVFVPWERVFCNGSVELANRWRTEETAYANFNFQTVVKNLAKAEFVLGVAMLLAESTGVDEYFHVQKKLGDLVSIVEQTEACVTAAVANAYQYQDTEFVVPDPTPQVTQITEFTRMYPRMVEIVRDLGGSGLIGIPAFEDLDADGPLGDDVATYFRGKDVDARTRLSIQKLAYEIAVSGFGGREALYERFSATGPMRAKSLLYHDYPEKEELKERALDVAAAARDE